MPAEPPSEGVASKTRITTTKTTPWTLSRDPRAGTPLMVARPLVGLELPLRVLVWQDPRGRVWVSYNESAFIAQRFGLPDGLEKNIASVPALIDEALR